MDSTGCLVYHKQRNSFVLISQFRAPVYYHAVLEQQDVSRSSAQQKKQQQQSEQTNVVPLCEEATLGLSLEFPAGLSDKDGLDIKNICREELIEEIGYSVPLEQLQFVNSYFSTLTRSTGKFYLYYCEVDDSMRVSNGGGVIDEGESIGIVEISIEEAFQLLQNTREAAVSPGLLYAISWWFLFKKPSININKQ